MASPVYQSDGGGVFAAANNNNAITVPLPATRPVGSVLLMAAFCRLITATAPTITGYTLLHTWTSGTASGGRMWLYGRIVDGTESAPSVTPVGATGTSGDLFGAGIVCYSGVDTSGGITAIFDGTPTTTDASGTTTCTYPALTIAQADSLVMRLLARWRDAADTFTPTATWNERADLGSTNRTGGQFHMQDKAATASGVQAAVTVAPSVTSAARYLAVTLALKGISPKQTSTAEISLASTTTPDTRTAHKLMVRARKTNAAHSGDPPAPALRGRHRAHAELETSALTTAFADYTLSVADVDAAAITSYSNLSIRLYGYSSSGTATVFEVSQLYLEAPATAGPAPTQRAISDTGATISDGLAREKSAFRTLSDTGCSITDSVKRSVSRTLVDQGATVSEALVAGQVRIVARTLADTGVEGGAPAFSPSSVTGLAIWLDASQLALGDGAAVTSWPDLSGAGRTLTSAVAPSFQTNELNGLPGVLFDGVDDYLTHLSGAAFVTGKEVTVFAVFKHLVYTENGRMMAFNATDDIDYQTPSWCIYEGSGGAQRIAPYSNGELAIHTTLPIAAVLMTTWFDAADTHNLRIDRAPASNPSVSTAQMGVFTFQTKRFTLGSGFIGIPTSSGNNIFHEVVIYDRALTGTERGQVEDYLYDKWLGAGLPAGEADSIAVTSAKGRVLSDTGASISDSLTRQKSASRALADTGAVISDTAVAARSRVRAISDTGATVSDSVAKSLSRARSLADTGATVADAVARTAVHPRTLADQGATVADSIALAAGSFSRALSDTGAAVGDSIAPTRVRARSLADTGATVSDSIARTAAHPRLLADTGATVIDSLARTATHPRSLSDTGATISDSLVRTAAAAARPVADTGTAISDSITRTATHPRLLADSGVTAGETLTRTAVHPRLLSDVGAAISDSLVKTAAGGRLLADTGATISDSLTRTAVHPRALSDTGATVSDSLVLARLRTVALADTGVAGAAAFSPDSITGLNGWFDASQLGLTDGAGVTTWPDLSGQGRHLIAGTPVYTEDVLNGLPVVRFDGIDDVLYTGATANVQHIFVVAMHRSAVFPDYDGLVGGVSWLILTGNSGTTTWYPYELANTAYHFDGVLVAAGDWPAPMNSQFAVMSVARVTPWPIDFQVGQDRNITGRNWDGDVAEVVVYDRALSETERQQVEGYLHDKWLGAGLQPGEADSIAVTHVNARTLADTGAAISDSIIRTFTPAPSGFNRAVTDQGATVSDALSRTATHPRSVTDTGATISDSIARSAARPRSTADTGATISDSITPKRLRAKAVADTGVALTETIRRALVRQLSDQGAAISDSLFVAAAIFLRSASDTAVTASDVLWRSSVGRKLVDTGATVIDAQVVGAMHRLTDTGAAITDSVRVKPGRFALDTGATVSDSIALVRVRARTLSDTGAAITESFQRNARPHADRYRRSRLSDVACQGQPCAYPHGCRYRRDAL